MSNPQQGANAAPKTPAPGSPQHQSQNPGNPQHQDQNPGSPKPADKKPNEQQT
jgi:hypothetical protein